MPNSFVEVAPSIHLSRRTLLRCFAGSAAVGLSHFPLASGDSSLLAQEAAAKGNLVPLNRFSRMVQEWFVEQVKQAEAKIKQRLASLQTKSDAEAYVRSVQ